MAFGSRQVIRRKIAHYARLYILVTGTKRVSVEVVFAALFVVGFGFAVGEGVRDYRRTACVWYAQALTRSLENTSPADLVALGVNRENTLLADCGLTVAALGRDGIVSPKLGHKYPAEDAYVLWTSPNVPNSDSATLVLLSSPAFRIADVRDQIMRRWSDGLNVRWEFSLFEMYFWSEILDMLLMVGAASVLAATLSGLLEESIGHLFARYRAEKRRRKRVRRKLAKAVGDISILRAAHDRSLSQLEFTRSQLRVAYDEEAQLKLTFDELEREIDRRNQAIADAESKISSLVEGSTERMAAVAALESDKRQLAERVEMLEVRESEREDLEFRVMELEDEKHKLQRALEEESLGADLTREAQAEIVKERDRLRDTVDSLERLFGVVERVAPLVVEQDGDHHDTTAKKGRLQSINDLPAKDRRFFIELGRCSYVQRVTLAETRGGARGRNAHRPQLSGLKSATGKLEGQYRSPSNEGGPRRAVLFVEPGRESLVAQWIEFVNRNAV